MSQANGRAATHEMPKGLRPARPCISPRGEGRPLTQANKQARFEQAVMPHLDAAYNLARWLTRDEHDAEDVVQEAYLRAYRFFDGFHGGEGDGRAWLLAVVRHHRVPRLQRNRA